ncbi:hypothetical protein CDD82_1424 [Ophiocordyceps australis]|uniref:STAS domain-containing protein n=1 Tax=Ophiocordyceps australis TaxID=1399860 RepID=A0A2C5YIN4_9HYPO|nr:hypothetical protein CDD82_1424 [Ophiocordyceps australis]
MYASVLGFSPWRTRASSVSSQPQQSSSPRSSIDSQPPPLGLSLPISASRQLSTSVGSAFDARGPIRSYIHTSVRPQPPPLDSEQNARTVRQDTAELASYLLSEASPPPEQPVVPQARDLVPHPLQSQDQDSADLQDADDYGPNTEPVSLHDNAALAQHQAPPNAESDDGPSVLSNLLKRSPPSSVTPHVSGPRDNRRCSDTSLPTHPRLVRFRQILEGSMIQKAASEETPLIGQQVTCSDAYQDPVDVEGQKNLPSNGRLAILVERHRKAQRRMTNTVQVLVKPYCWNRQAIWNNIVLKPISCLPAVAVGILLNILDALSYGMILFPLGKPVFAHLGPAGLSIFYVSSIISQLVFSSGSKFKGAVGSELIEVVPFFHNMALKIMKTVGTDKPDAVVATTIVSYAISSMTTGLVFYLMGRFKFGYVVGFIPRHILIGCIGGVGWFLIATGFQVSARLEGSFEYDKDTLLRLTQPGTIPMWALPLFMAMLLFYGQAKIRSKYFLPLFILCIPLAFYLLVLCINGLDADMLRDRGWVFQGPPPGEPWWYFYTLYQFDLVHWAAIVQVIPAMLALTFFGILHVPINVPALALNCGEDNVDLDRELKLHGYSNFLSGCCGSIQNYLVYANTILFIRSGGDARLAGFMLASFTFGVMMMGPSLVGFIPVMMVATLIFDLGFELLLEAVWLPRKKFKPSEYLTVIAIVLVMGIHDFVVGILVGILLAFVSLVIQTSRVSAIRSTYDGDIVTSTVRRNPSQQKYLRKVGRQIYIVKLTGYMFFGTVVSVEEKIRSILVDSAFAKKPINFLIIDLWHVSGVDYSAGEAFKTINRLLHNKGVDLIISGVDEGSALGRHLSAAGIGSDEIEVLILPNLNLALESCENRLLKTLYARQEELNARKRLATSSLDVPTAPSPRRSFDAPLSSPRQSQLAEAAYEAVNSAEIQRLSRWQNFGEPLRLMLQIFQGLSDKNEDYWFQTTCYFERREYETGTVLFERGEAAKCFYLVERGIIRAEYDLPQGWLCESIVAGTTCGELPFFSETERTAKAQVDRDCVVWQMDGDAWHRLQADQPDVAQELLKMSLKLTSERMSAITSYILAMAG